MLSNVDPVAQLVEHSTCEFSIISKNRWLIICVVGSTPTFGGISQVRILLSVLNAGVEGSSPSRVTRLFDIINMGQRRSWRGGTDCNNRVNCIKSQIGNMLEVSEYHTLLQSQSVVVRLSRFDSYLTHYNLYFCNL